MFFTSHVIQRRRPWLERQQRGTAQLGYEQNGLAQRGRACTIWAGTHGVSVKTMYVHGVGGKNVKTPTARQRTANVLNFNIGVSF